MTEFNYIEYLRNNPLTNLKNQSKSTLTEGIDGDIKAALTSVGSDSEINQYMVSLKNSNDEFEDVEDYVEDFKNYIADKGLEETSSPTKMKVSELKAKIKEDILSTLNEEDTTLEDELMSQLNEITGEVFSRIDGLTNERLKSQFLNKFSEIYEDMVDNGDAFDVGDVIEYLSYQMQEFSQDINMGSGNLAEAKDDEEEDVEVEVGDEEEGEDVGGGDVDAIDPEAGLTQDEQDIQNALKVAFDNANAIGDEKLADQIGNTITMFTRTHVVNR